MTATSTWIEAFNSEFEAVFAGLQYVRFNDGEGFSLITKYPDNYRKQMGIDDTVRLKPFFKFIFYPDESVEDGKYVPLIVDVSQTTEQEEEDGTTKYMLNDSRVKRMRPIGLRSRDDYFIKTTNGATYKLVKGEYVQYSLKDIYDRILEVHISNWRTPEGFLLRLRQFVSRSVLSKSLKGIAWLAGSIMWVIRGKAFRYDVIKERYQLGPTNSSNQATPPVTPEEDINFFGYKVGVWTLFTYCLTIFIIYSFFTSCVNDYLNAVKPAMAILAIILAIVSIVLYDKVLPWLLKKCVKYFEIFSYDLKYAEIKIKV